MLDSTRATADNEGMDVLGRVHNGVVVLEGGVVLPEGAAVRVLCPAGPRIRVSPIRKRVQLPLVKTDHPGSLALTNDRIAEILEAEDVEAMKGQWDVSS
jgi:hypothetical protein